jgi:hypothetical protein
MSTPAQVPFVVIPRCPGCKRDLTGGNVCEMKLPVMKDGKISAYWKFLMFCCPFSGPEHEPQCGVVISATFGGFEQVEPGAGSGLWTPPGRN